MTAAAKTIEKTVTEAQNAAEAMTADAVSNARQVTEKTIDNARAAYDELKGAAQETVDVLDGSANAFKTGTADLNAKAIEYAQTNLNASFDFARKAMTVTDVRELFELQTAFAQNQFKACATQMQDLTNMTAKLAENTSRPLADGMTKSFEKARKMIDN